MKGESAIKQSYEKQKYLFETAQQSRIRNREKSISQINEKIARLESSREKLILQNQEEKEFENFNSFRLKAKEQSLLQKRNKTSI